MHALFGGRRHFERQSVSWRFVFKIVSGYLDRRALTLEMRWPEQKVGKWSLPAEGRVLRGKVTVPAQEGRSDVCGMLQEAREAWPGLLSCLSPAQNPPLVSHLTGGKCQSPHKTLHVLTTRSQVQEPVPVHTHTHTRTPRLLDTAPLLSLLLCSPATPVFPAHTKYMPTSQSALSVPSAPLYLRYLVFSIILITFGHTV